MAITELNDLFCQSMVDYGIVFIVEHVRRVGEGKSDLYVCQIAQDP